MQIKISPLHGDFPHPSVRLSKLFLFLQLPCALVVPDLSFGVLITVVVIWIVLWLYFACCYLLYVDNGHKYTITCLYHCNAKHNTWSLDRWLANNSLLKILSESSHYPFFILCFSKKLCFPSVPLDLSFSQMRHLVNTLPVGAWWEKPAMPGEIRWMQVGPGITCLIPVIWNSYLTSLNLGVHPWKIMTAIYRSSSFWKGLSGYKLQANDS